MPPKSPVKLFSGEASLDMARKISSGFGTSLGKKSILHYSDGEFQTCFEESVRGSTVFIIQSTFPPTENLFELLLLIDGAKRASAYKIVAVIPYFGFARQDRKDKPRVSIGAKLVADLLEAAGVSRVMTMDLHTDQIQGFFNIPVDELTAIHLLTDYFKKKYANNFVVVAADIGISRRARDIALRLSAPLAIIEQRRIGNVDKKEALNIIGEVEGKKALIVDDEIDTAGTLTNVVSVLLKNGAKEVFACATHPTFSGSAIQRIKESAVKEVVVTNTIPVTGTKKLDKITVLSIAPLLGEAIRRIHTGQSVGAMFEQ